MLRTLATNIARTTPTVTRKTRQAFVILAAFTCGVAAVWTTWGLGAGLGATCIALLAAEGLSEMDSKENPT